LEHGIGIGRGEVFLNLTTEQYAISECPRDLYGNRNAAAWLNRRLCHWGK